MCILPPIAKVAGKGRFPAVERVFDERVTTGQAENDQKDRVEKKMVSSDALDIYNLRGRCLGEVKPVTLDGEQDWPESLLLSEDRLEEDPGRSQSQVEQKICLENTCDWGLELQCAWSEASGLGTVQEKHGQFGGSLEHRGAQLDDDFSPPQYRASQRQCLEVDEGPTSHLEQKQNGGPLVEEHAA
ncbi:hypothetical protein SKAU_G00423700 [Synaphobranchus kaupii]|uniref:Uncharacterized protein n=1 Tax=Synaphobranchus kaupii TaxID=118154 RepID=A0A9Q1IAJ3_SYNKA|nr:hypothetical protein SKAU_G00423700 [Synaphobranchus kaupii]